MIGKLAPKQYQGVMMASWMLVTGLASLALCRRFLGNDPRTNRHHSGRHRRWVRETLHRAWRRQPRGRYCARRADSVPAQADHRQGRDNSRRSANPRRSRCRRGVKSPPLPLLYAHGVIYNPAAGGPPDLKKARAAAAPKARTVWSDITPIARRDWIHWITSVKQAETRARRIKNACSMLAAGKRRVCCFDRSGFYSKSVSAPKAAV